MLKSCAGPVIRHSPLSLSSFVIRASSFLLAMSLPFKKVLIANRGEVALRIIRACRELGVPSALVYSEADRDSLPVLIADEAVCIGPSPAPDSYTNVSRILSAAEITKADALHPGYGFLSESPEFIEATESCKMVFIGPTVAPLRLARDKILHAGNSLAGPAWSVCPVPSGEVVAAADAGETGRRLGYPISSSRLGAAAARRRHAAGNTGQGQHTKPGSDVPKPKPRPLLVTAGSTSKSTWLTPVTSRFSFWPTVRAILRSCPNATARSSSGTENCWRKARRRRSASSSAICLAVGHWQSAGP